MAKVKAKAKKPAAAKKKPAAKAKKPVAKKSAPRKPPPLVLTSLRTAIYKVDDLAKAKAFYSAALGRAPYFDEPFYVGYDIDGQELGLDPDVSRQAPGPGGTTAYWKVPDIHGMWARLTTELGGAPIELPHNVGGNILTAIVGDPFGNLVGLIELP